VAREVVAAVDGGAVVVEVVVNRPSNVHRIAVSTRPSRRPRQKRLEPIVPPVVEKISVDVVASAALVHRDVI
jgi:hypothetical protein